MGFKKLKNYCNALIFTVAAIAGSVAAPALVSHAVADVNDNNIVNESIPVITDFTGTVEEDNFILSWNCNADEYTYRISYSHSLDGDYSLYGTYSSSLSNNQIELGGIRRGVPYYYKIELISYYRAIEGGDYSDAYGENIIIDNPVPVYTSEMKLNLEKPVITAINPENNCIMNVKWTGVDGASGYELYRSTSQEGTYSKVGTREVQYYNYNSDGYYDYAGNEYQYAEKDLSYKQTYYYKVLPYVTYNDTTYYGSFSAISSNKVSENYIVPKISDLNVEVSGNYAFLSWKGNITDYKYKIYYSNSKNGKYKLITEGDSYNYYSENDGLVEFSYDRLTRGVSYYFKVIITSFNTDTVDSNGNLTNDYIKKKSKSVISKRVINSLDKPYLEIQNVDSQGIKLLWSPIDGASGYYIYRSESKKGPFVKVGAMKKKKKETYKEKYQYYTYDFEKDDYVKKYDYIEKTIVYKYTDTKLTLGKTYYYKVCPYKIYKGKKYSNEFSDIYKKKVTLNNIYIKSAVSKKPKTNTITWNKIPKATGYTIYYSKSVDGRYKKLKDIKGNKKTSYTHKKLTNGQAYYYKVAAYKVLNGKRIKNYCEPYEKYCDYYAYENESYYNKAMRIQGKSEISQYPSYNNAIKHMKTIRIKAWDIDYNNDYYTRTFNLTVNKNIAPTVQQIFKEIYNCKKKTPIHAIGGFDWTGTKNEHKLGLAIDVNPNENPMYDDGVIVVGSFFDPDNCPYSIADDSEFVRIMRKYGFYRGKWGTRLDYMHFSYFGT